MFQRDILYGVKNKHARDLNDGIWAWYIGPFYKEHEAGHG